MRREAKLLEASLLRYRLTSAESRVAAAICRGLSGKAAARELGISYNTLKTHLKKIFRKTGTRRQTELIVLVTAQSRQSCYVSRL
jgi:DNA-binding CsgD family transcriptional regulator